MANHITNIPFKLASRENHPANTLIKVGDVTIGEGLTFIAGPCAVESEAALIELAFLVKASGAKILRGGAFKPRTSPYDFQGIGKEGIDILVKVKEVTGMPVVSEIVDAADIDVFRDIDILQIGSRNMQNFSLLKAVGRSDKAVLLKRGYASTYEELLLAAEYILAEGNEKVILCERGVRSFESYTRNTLDINAVPSLHELTHLPVIVDPSHSTGKSTLVKPASLAAAAVGADGLIIEVHQNPEASLSDGAQAVTPAEFGEIASIAEKVKEIAYGK
nr:3-deoxy-7-phosphoheptulonate synthase [uncultured Mogibacterium sp.]